MKVLLISLLLTLSFNALANVIIYRWVDENNVVHFSQNQPNAGDYTELTMNNTQLTHSKEKDKPSKNVNDSLVKLDPKEDGVSENLTNDTTERCNEAKKNLTTLTDFNRIRFVNSKGETQILNEAEQKEQITINKERVNLYCKSSSAN